VNDLAVATRNGYTTAHSAWKSGHLVPTLSATGRMTKANSKERFRTQELCLDQLVQMIHMFGRSTLESPPCVVMDNFAGTCSTAVAAYACGCYSFVSDRDQLCRDIYKTYMTNFCYGGVSIPSRDPLPGMAGENETHAWCSHLLMKPEEGSPKKTTRSKKVHTVET